MVTTSLRPLSSLTNTACVFCHMSGRPSVTNKLTNRFMLLSTGDNAFERRRVARLRSIMWREAPLPTQRDDSSKEQTSKSVNLPKQRRVARKVEGDFRDYFHRAQKGKKGRRGASRHWVGQSPTCPGNVSFGGNVGMLLENGFRLERARHCVAAALRGICGRQKSKRNHGHSVLHNVAPCCRVYCNNAAPARAIVKKKKSFKTF